jgi:cytochrome b6-f complex iron-sulfur subunit
MPDEPTNEAAPEEAPKPAPTPKQPPRERAAETAVAKAAPGGRQLAAAGAPAVVVVQPPPQGFRPPAVSRRRVLQVGFWAALGGMLTGIFVTILNMVYPRGITGFGSTIFVGTVDQLQPGKKIHNLDAKAWLVRFDAAQAARNPGAQEGAILALYHKCPHLGCTVPYNESFSFTDPLSNETYPGWFRCPCHGSTYSDAGRRVFGPAPRSMDTFALTINNGQMIVNTGKITLGDVDNGSRAILPG